MAEIMDVISHENRRGLREVMDDFQYVFALKSRRSYPHDPVHGKFGQKIVKQIRSSLGFTLVRVWLEPVI